MPPIKKFYGINNVARSESARSGELQTAVNVYVDDSNNLCRRLGFTSMYTGSDVHSLNADTGNLLYVDGTTLYKYDAVTPVTLLESLTESARMGYLYINNRLYFSNGYETGIYNNNEVRSWGLVAPQPPTLYAVSGNLTKGTYQVTLTYMRTDGQESGCSEIRSVDVPDNGGIRITGLAASADPDVIGVGVYCTGNGGEVLPDGSGLYRYLVVLNAALNSDVTITDLSSMGTGATCRTYGTYPPPAGNLIWFYRGRMYIATGNVIWYTEPWLYENVRLDSAFMILPDNITNALPVETGIWITTEKESMFLAGKDPLADGGFEIRTRSVHQCFAGGVLVNSHAADVRGAAPGIQAMWVAEDGVFIGDGIGIKYALTSDTWHPAGTTGLFGTIVGDQYMFGMSNDSGVLNHTMNISRKAICDYDREFTSLVNLGGIAYGSTETDIFEHSGNTDDDEAIQAEIEKSGISFNSSMSKSVTEVYLHAGTNGPLRITVTSESGSGVYDTPVSASTAMKGHKAHGPRGVKGRNFTFNVQNVDGVDFVLNEIDPLVAISTRHGR